MNNWLYSHSCTFEDIHLRVTSPNNACNRLFSFSGKLYLLSEERHEKASTFIYASSWQVWNTKALCYHSWRDKIAGGVSQTELCSTQTYNYSSWYPCAHVLFCFFKPFFVGPVIWEEMAGGEMKTKTRANLILIHFCSVQLVKKTNLMRTVPTETFLTFN